MIYRGADEAIRLMNRRNLKAFGRLKLANFDEITLVRAVSEVYEGAIEDAKQRYYEIAVDAYIAALYLSGMDIREATGMADRRITRDWVEEMLEEVDYVMMYRFIDEAERKKARLIEALSVAPNKQKEIQKALKYWAFQIGQFAITFVDAARLMGFKDGGIEEVMWNTERDEKVCEICNDLDGKIFPIDKAPHKQHPNCRCYLTPVIP